MRRLLSLLALALLATPIHAEDNRLDTLFEELSQPDEPGWKRIEEAIWEEWSETGSPSLDYLLTRGREALSAGKGDEAIEHFTALIENAPDFPEGYNARATAYFDADLYGPAMSDIARTLTLEPRHFGALSGLGLILEETGDKQRALKAYQAARAIHPHRPDLIKAVERLEAELQGSEI